MFQYANTSLARRVCQGRGAGIYMNTFTYAYLNFFRGVKCASVSLPFCGHVKSRDLFLAMENTL